MKGRTKIFGILALIMLITPVTISVAANVIEKETNTSTSNQSNEYETLLGGGYRLRHFREIYIEAELGKYEIKRTPYNTPYWESKWPGPVMQMLSERVIKWSFTSGTGEIRCYTNWEGGPDGMPVPYGDPAYTCKKIWFHDFTGRYWDYETHKLGGVVVNGYILGAPTS